MIAINATVILWFIVKRPKSSSSKSSDGTWQWIVTLKAEEILLWWLGCQKGWALDHLENGMWSPWARAIHEDGLCLWKESQTYHWPQQLSVWEPETCKAEHKPLVHIYQFSTGSEKPVLLLGQFCESGWGYRVVQKYFPESASYGQNVQAF